MPVFQYVALDSQGVEIKDEIDALSEKEAISKIRTMGYFPTKVRPKAAAKAGAGKAGAKAKRRRGAGAKVKVKQITQFARQLSTLQDAGLPILRSLRILEEQQKAGNQAQAHAAAHGLGCEGDSWIGQVVSDHCQGKILHGSDGNARVEGEPFLHERAAVALGRKIHVLGRSTQKHHVAKGERQRSTTQLAALTGTGGRGLVVRVEESSA